MGVLALLWGSSFLWIKLALAAFSPMTITLIRTALGAGLLVILCLASRQRLPRERRIWAHMLVAALFGNLIPFTLFGVGELTVNTGIAGVLNATTPLWALLIGIAIGTERSASPVRIIGLLLGFGGVLLIFAPWQTAGLVSWGALALLAAAASYAIAYTYIGRFITSRSGTPTALSASQLITATALTALVVPATAGHAGHITALAVIAVAILGLLGTGLAFVLNYRLIADEGSTNATTVGYLLPVVSVLLGAIVLDEPLNLRVIAGMAVVLAGVAMTRLRPRTPAPVLAPELAGVRP